MAEFRLSGARAILAGGVFVALAGCAERLDFDLRGTGAGGTSGAARAVAQPRPDPDGRGVISYSSFQVALARPGDTVADVAARVGLPADELARYNGLSPDSPLRNEEVVALPTRVAATSSAGGGEIDVQTLADSAIDQAGSRRTASDDPPFRRQGSARTGREPKQHQVRPGETAYTIARSYGVPVAALADWNGLGPDHELRQGQYLMIPVVERRRVRAAAVAAPGEGSPTPTPPSASKPLPTEDESPRAETPPSPNLGSERTEVARLQPPVSGNIIREYGRSGNEGVDLAADAGTSVLAAEDGEVAAITRDKDQAPIVVLRHDGDLLTVYANIDAVKVSKGDRVGRGQAIAVVRAGDPSFLHFEVRRGFDSVDPVPFIN